MTDYATNAGIGLIAAERERQIAKEGWSAEHDDDHHHDGSLVLAALCYLWHPRMQHENRKVDRGSSICGYARDPDPVLSVPIRWPWEPETWKPGPNRIRDLTKAGALIAAEIDRLTREAALAERKNQPMDNADKKRIIEATADWENGMRQRQAANDSPPTDAGEFVEETMDIDLSPLGENELITIVRESRASLQIWRPLAGCGFHTDAGRSLRMATEILTLRSTAATIERLEDELRITDDLRCQQLRERIDSLTSALTLATRERDEARKVIERIRDWYDKDETLSMQQIAANFLSKQENK